MMLNAVLDQTLEGRISWIGKSLGEDDGSLVLDASCLLEIHEFARILEQNPVPTLALRPDDFEMPACRRLMEQARAVLEDGVGFVLIDRLPVAEIGREAATAVYWLLCSMISRPVAQKWDGAMIYDVRDTGRKPGNGVRPDVTNVEQNFHTDNSYNLCPPDYVSLLCLQTAKEGGVSSIVSFASAHNAMRRQYPELLKRLYRPYWFDRQREHAPDDVRVLSHPLFEVENGRLLARLSRFQVLNGYKLAGEEIDPEGFDALEALESIMNQPGMSKEFYFERGQIQIVDNRRCGHRRTEFRDFPEPERKRHLVRLWLRERGRTFYNG